MRRRAVIAGFGAALLAAALPGMRGGLPLASTTPGNERLSSRRSRQCETLSQEAQLAIDRHDESAAEELLHQLLAMSPRSAEAQNRLGRVLLARQQLPEAEQAYRHAIELDPEYVAAMTGLGSTDYAIGRFEEALRQFEAAIELDPTNAQAHLQRGRALEALGRKDDALAAYFRALEFAPDHVATNLRVATLELAVSSLTRRSRGSTRSSSRIPKTSRPAISEGLRTSLSITYR